MTSIIEPKEEPIRVVTLFRFLREHPAISGTLLYAQVSAVGVLYGWTFYREFGINVFEFSEASDFLLAAFKEPLSFLVTAITCLTFILFSYFADVRGRRYTRGSREHFNLRYNAVTFLVLALVYSASIPVIFALHAADSLKTISPGKHVVNIGPVSRSTTGTAVENVTFVGIIQNFVFFFDSAAGRTNAVPISSLTSIEFPAEAEGSESDEEITSAEDLNAPTNAEARTLEGD